MIDFDLVEKASDDLWSDHESQDYSAKLARFSAADWDMLVSELPSMKAVVQERIAQILGEFNVEPAADLLLSFAGSKNREIALTARESLRGMNLKVVVTSAKRLVSRKQLILLREVEYKSINEILDAIEAKPVLPGAA